MNPHRTKIESALLTERIRAIVSSSDFEIKQLAGDFNLSVPYAHAIVRRLGYNQMLVSDHERRHILTERAFQKTRKAS